jgi:DNA-binding SARP family transcriptional activator
LDERAREVIGRLVAEQQLVLELIESLNGLLDPPEQSLSKATGTLQGARREAVLAGPSIAVNCLGSFQLRIDERLFDSWRPTKALALLQYLLVHRARPTPREVLIEALWPDPDALAAGSSLKVAVHTLRQMLSELVGEAPALSVQAHAAGYQLVAPELWVDAEEFERRCQAGRRLDAQGESAQAVQQYTLAADLYRGDFLESSLAEWALLRRESLKDQFLYVVGRLSIEAMEAGDYHDCILRCQQVLQHDPCREDTYRLLMEAHGRLGQRARVQSWYDVCVRTLDARLDIAPEPETDTVYRHALTDGAVGVNWQVTAV